MSDSIPTSEVLNRAADLIEERGWGHGTDSMTGVDGLCLMGAIHAATFGHFDEFGYKQAAMCPAGRAVYQHLALDLDEADAGWEWNDSKWQVHRGKWFTENPGEVVEVLRATAVIEAARENKAAAALLNLADQVDARVEVSA